MELWELQAQVDLLVQLDPAELLESQARLEYPAQLDQVVQWG